MKKVIILHLVATAYSRAYSASNINPPITYDGGPFKNVNQVKLQKRQLPDLNSTAPVGSEVVGLITGSPSDSKGTDVSTNTDRNGYNAFKPAKATSYAKEKAITAAILVVSLVAILVLGGGFFGLVAAIILQTIAGFFRPKPPSSGQVYAAIYGRLQFQINAAINNEYTAKLIDKIETLSHTIYGQFVAYMALIGISPDEDAATKLNEFEQGISVAPTVFADQVDLSMKSIDSILNEPNNWYTSNQGPEANQTFVLAGAQNIHAKYCLHPKDGNINSGNELRVDADCPLNSLDDKLWLVHPTSGQVLLYSNNGLKCISYDNGQFGYENPASKVGIYDISDDKCNVEIQKRVIKMRDNGDGYFSLMDGEKELCLHKDGQLTTNQDTPYRRRKRTRWAHNECINDGKLGFKKIHQVLNNLGFAGATGSSGTPINTFDEIGVQVYYFPRIAVQHLTALKEMYLHGQAIFYAQAAYYRKVQEYIDWIDQYVPIFEQYAQFKGINATVQIQDIKFFRTSLTKANLGAPVMSNANVEPPKEDVAVTSVATPPATEAAA